jgi:hypothetical protein
MNDQNTPYEFPLMLRVPRSAFTIVAAEPATVTQRTVEQHFGVPPRLYKEMARDGLFPTKKIRRLIFAAYNDVKRVLTEGAVARSRVNEALAEAAAAPEPDPIMTAASAHAYLDSARSPQEQRARKQELEAQASETMSAYGPKLDDGSPNPKHDKRLYEQGMDLFLAALGVGKKAPLSAESGPTPGVGYYRQCCWCERPAYATKQTWYAEKWYWSGGPVCHECARRRAPNERVVQLEGRKILLPARDPTVPTGWDRPRRPRRR